MVGVVTQAVQARAFLEVRKFEVITHICILPDRYDDRGDDPTMYTPEVRVPYCPTLHSFIHSLNCSLVTPISNNSASLAFIECI